jgi:hypothetical protein
MNQEEYIPQQGLPKVVEQVNTDDDRARHLQKLKIQKKIGGLIYGSNES